MKRKSMARRAVAAAAAAAAGLGLTVALVAPADATITNPSADGAVLSGSVTFSDSGATSNGSACVNGTAANTTFSLLTPGGVQLWTNSQSGTGAKTSAAVDTTQFPNSNYTLRVVETNRTGTLSCSNNSTTLTRSIVLNNGANAVQPQVINGTMVFPGQNSLSDGTLCVGGSGPNATFTLQSYSTGATTSLGNVSGTGVLNSPALVTENLANGIYVLTISEHSRSGTLACSSSDYTTTRLYSVTNVSSLALNSPASAPQNTSVSVSATLTDPNATPDVLVGRSVTFSLGGGGSVTATTDAQGVATANLAINGTPRSSTVTASFAGESNHTASSANKAITITKDATKTTLDSPTAVVHGQSTSFTAHVAATEGGGTPTGTVQFSVDGVALGSPVTLVGGNATSPSTSTLSTASHDIDAAYSGDSNYFASNAATQTAVVGKAATTTTLANDPTSTVSGQAVTFTATVGVVSPGVGNPTGAVQFDVDGNPYGTAVALDGNHASVTISNLHAGNHEVSATYNGDADFQVSSSADLTHGVNRADTTTHLTTSVTTPLSGQTVSYTAKVTPNAPGGGSPSGTVQFSVDGTPLGDPVAVDSSGSATSPDTHLLVGTYHITADYSGDGDFAGGSDALDQSVIPAHVATTLTTSPNPSVTGQAITLHAEVATVAPATGHPTGAIKFVIDGANSQGTYVDLVDGVAELTLPNGLAVGDHSIKAIYNSDDENYVAGSNDTVTQTVNKAATKTTLDSSANPSVYGQHVTFTATVSVVAPGAGNPSGTVTFTDGSDVIGTQDVSSSTGEQASITVDDLAVATHAITATYSGDDSFNGSNGAIAQTVQRAQTSTVVTSSANPAQSGQGVKFTAVVSPVAPGAGDPTGTVTFTVNGAQLGTPVAVVNGSATSSAFASLTPGTYAIAAAYSGDHNFVKSSGSLDQGNGLNVAKGATTLDLSGNSGTSAYGDAVTFHAHVTAVAPATGHPSGVVQFWKGGQLLGAASLASDGANASSADFVSSSLTPGANTVTATYVGNFNFIGSSDSADQMVEGAPTVTGVTADPNPITFGDSVELTATVGEAIPAPGAPTGTVTFLEGSQVLGTADVGAGGTASITVDGLGGGDHSVKAVYGGGGIFTGSTSDDYTVTVNRAASHISAQTLITLQDSYLHIRVGYVQATVTGLNGAPLAGRTVVFTTTRVADGAVVPVCTAVTNADGVAKCSNNVVNTVRILLTDGYDATFIGDGDYASSTDHGEEL